MILHKHTVAFLILLFTSSVSYADFEVQKDYCTISNRFVGKTSDNIEYDGVVNISFTTTNVVLPIININLSRNINPTDFSIGWPNVKLLDSQQRPLFEKSFQDRIVTEKDKVFGFKKEDSSFYSQPYGFYRFQHFIALFLSQNDFVIHFKNEDNGKLETQVVPLSGSDMSFREMTYHCHQAQVTNYINSDLTRKKPVHESWTVGYGITDFYKYEQYLPEEVKFPNDITKVLNGNSVDGYNALSAMYPMLVKKADLTQKVVDVEAREDFVTLKTEVDQKAETVLNLNQQIDAIGGKNGRIKAIELEIQTLDEKIGSTQKSVDIYEQQLDPLEEKFSILSVKIEELRSQMNEFDKKINLTQEQSAKYQENIKYLSQLLETYASEYVSSDLKAEEEKVVSTPYSLEVIQESDKKIKEQIRQRVELTQVISLVNSIGIYMNKLVEDHKKALDLFNQMSDLKIKRVKLQESFVNAQLEEIEIHRGVGGMTFESISKHINEDKSNTALKGLKNSGAKEKFLADIRLSYTNYDTFVDGLKTNEKNLLAIILCKSEMFLRSYRGQCFNPIELQDVKNIPIYLDQLDSTDISYLASLVTGENSLIHRYESGIVSTVADKMALEVKTDSIKKVMELWDGVLYARWRHYAIKSATDTDDFRIESLVDVLNSQKEDLKNVLAQQKTITSQITSSDKSINQLNTKFLKTESEYFASLEHNQKLILTELSNNSLNPSKLNLECLLEISNVDFCSQTLNSVQIKTSESLSSLSQEIKGSVVLLVLASQKQLSEIEGNLSKATTDMNITTEARNTFIRTSNYVEKSESFKTEKTELNRQRLRLKTFYEQKAIAEQAKIKLQSERQVIQSEHTDLTKQMKSLVAEMQPTLVKLKPICDEQNKNISELVTVDEQINKTLSITQKSNSVNSLCQIKF